jgi:organic radical activating enzyme
MARDYYCNNKFKYLKIDAVNKCTLSCCATKSVPIDFKRIETTPGDIFNIPEDVSDREKMLRNERTDRCEANCWKAEDFGAPSQRDIYNGSVRSHTSVRTDPEVLELLLTRDCNCACSYCCREYSTRWSTELDKFGNYEFTHYVDERFNRQSRDYDVNNLQKNIINQPEYKLLESEILSLIPKVKKIVITGGEPLLNKFFDDILELANKNKNIETIQLSTGLNTSQQKFDKLISRMKENPNIELRVSVENTGKYAEFNRYGITWELTQSRINQLIENGLDFSFRSTLSNLTILNFSEFYKKYENQKILPYFAMEPTFMKAGILDDDSKNLIVEDLDIFPIDLQEKIKKSLNYQPTEEERLTLKEFLLQYQKRRNDLSLQFLPESFLHWLGIRDQI